MMTKYETLKKETPLLNLFLMRKTLLFSKFVCFLNYSKLSHYSKIFKFKLQQLDGYVGGIDYPNYAEIPSGLSFSCQGRLPGKDNYFNQF